MSSQNQKSKLIVILGPTASGKTKLAVLMAAKLNGEIVSADSRQVYRGLDVGTGKDLQDYRLEIPNSNDQIPNKSQVLNPELQIRQIPYHLIDVASPKQRFDLAKYQEMAFNAIDDILQRGKLPILAGGSGLYLQAVVDNYKLSDIESDLILRKKLEQLNAGELFKDLEKLSPKLAARLNQSDKNNKRRLIRYLEIVGQGSVNMKKNDKRYRTLLIGLSLPPKELKDRIKNRLLDRLEKQDLIGEVKRLHRQGLSWKKLESFGLEYKFVSLYLQKKLSYEDMVEKLDRAINQFVRRQMSWFRRWEKQGTEINWVKDETKAEKLIKKFLKKEPKIISLSA